MDANTQVRLDGGHLCGGGSVRRACPEIRMGVAPAAPCQCHRGRMLPPTSELFSFPHGIGTLSRPVHFEDRKGRLSPELVWESSAAHPRASALSALQEPRYVAKANTLKPLCMLSVVTCASAPSAALSFVYRVSYRGCIRGRFGVVSHLLEAVTCVATYSRRGYNVAMFLRDGPERGLPVLVLCLLAAYISHSRHVQRVSSNNNCRV